MELQEYINGVPVEPSANMGGFLVELAWDKDRNYTKKLSNYNLDLVLAQSKIVNNHLSNGVNGGVGIFEGLPYKLEVTQANQVINLLDGYIDLTENAQFSTNNTKSTVTVKERKNIDWLNDRAGGFTFEYLFATNKITTADYEFMPYVLNSVPDYREAIMAILSSYVITTSLLDAIEKVTELIIEVSNVAEWTAIVRLSLYLVYLTSLIIAITKLITDLVQMIIQPVKYHACMSALTLLQKGAEHLGLNVSCSFLQTGGDFEGLMLMPEKQSAPVNSTFDRLLGFTDYNIIQNGYLNATFEDLLVYLKGMFNAKINLITDSFGNTTLHLERRDKNIIAPQLVLKPFYTDKFGVNADEFRANYLIKFSTDVTDKNTIQEYTGTAFQVITKPNITTVGNEDLILMKGLERVDIPFALAKRKTELSVPEKIIETLLNIVDALTNTVITLINGIISGLNAIINLIDNFINAINAIPGININWQIPTISNINPVDFSGLIENRIGMMKIEYDTFVIPKVLLMTKGSEPKYNKISVDNSTKVTARYLYDNYHFINSFIPSAGATNANQYYEYDLENVPFSYEDFTKVLATNSILTDTGAQGLIYSLQWNPDKQSANIKYGINKLYTNNLVSTNLEPNGQ